MRYFIVFILFFIQTARSFDFAQYTVIDEETKTFLQKNRRVTKSDSSFKSGKIGVFGNSLTVEDDFWSNIPGSALGIVPGTSDSMYSSDYKCANYGNTMWDASYCIKAAVERVKPEVVLMMFGTNEALGAQSNVGWEEWQSQYGVLIDSLLSIGTIPIISTIPPAFESYDSTDVPVDTITQGINGVLRELAKKMHVVLVDYNQAFIDYTKGDIFNKKWWGDTYVHPSSDCEPDTMEPTCGYGIRNAVCWQALNKVYRIIIEDGLPDTGISYEVAIDAAKQPARPKHRFSVTTIPGTSTIKIVSDAHAMPDVIRLYTLQGKMVNCSVVQSATHSFVTIHTTVPGTCCIEAIINGKAQRSRVLLMP